MKITELLGLTVEELREKYGFNGFIAPEDPIEGDNIYFKVPERGLAFVLDVNGKVSCIQAFGRGKSSGYNEFPGEVVEGISVHSSRDAVRSVLGLPRDTENGGKGKGLFGLDLNPWDAFYLGRYRVHFEYSPDGGRILLVSVENV
nr:hypothetical protein [Massilia sp. PDC64]